MIDFRTHPGAYRHWRIETDAGVARLVLDVDPEGGLLDGYELKQNSYDLGVDIELADAIDRLRFEHPEVGTVFIESAHPSSFCAGANIRMLAGSDHALKVNFCKFTNETRNGIEQATSASGQRYIAALRGTAAGGGYELALATDHIVLVDDGNAAVSLPEVPLLAVLPGTGGLTRLTDKRCVRRDLADAFATREEGLSGQRALEWNLVDEVVATSRFDARLAELPADSAARPLQGIELTPIERQLTPDSVTYDTLAVQLDRAAGTARIALQGPTSDCPADGDAAASEGARFWPLQLLRELDDALLHLRFNEPTLGTLLLESQGSADRVLAYDQLLFGTDPHWFLREVRLKGQRTFSRLDLTARTLVTLLTPGSCFAGFLAELVLAADRSFMLDGIFEDHPERGLQPATLTLTRANLGALPTCQDLSRLESRFWGDRPGLDSARAQVGMALDAAKALAAGLVTHAPDDIDWDEDLRLLIEARASFSADALTAMEANLRFPGPETLHSKIFARLSAWQNWVFQRPNATGSEGALPAYGTGHRPKFDPNRT